LINIINYFELNLKQFYFDFQINMLYFAFLYYIILHNTI
jgi:hypothetical protein